MRSRLAEPLMYCGCVQAFDEQAILDGLSQSLRTDINIFICRDLIYRYTANNVS